MRVCITVLILGAVLFSFFQCKTKVAKPDQGANPTENIPDAEKMRDTPYGLWILQEVQGSSIGVKKGTFIKISERSYYLYAGCNNFSGELKIKADSMTIQQGRTTLMACNDMGYEGKLSGLIWTVHRFKLEDNQLMLYAGKDIILTFKKQTPTEHLVGRHFEVTGITINGGVHSSVDAPLQTMQFNPDGTLTGNAGCNSYSGAYKIEGDLLCISQVVSTKMACAEQKKMQYESVFHQHVRKSPLRIEDSPQQVTLRDSNGSTVMVLAEK